MRLRGGGHGRFQGWRDKNKGRPRHERTRRLKPILRFGADRPTTQRGLEDEATIMLAAAHHSLAMRGTIAAAKPLPPTISREAVSHDMAAINGLAQVPLSRMTATPPSTKPREFVIRGVTLDGRSFRPSDWAERLASAMSCFRPEGSVGGIGAFIGYSPFCVPTVVGGVKCVIVNEALKGIEPMAWDFVMNFARDNQLQLGEVSGGPPAPG
jgi:hypothetical protein